MKVIMAGYEKTKKIISASSYLMSKYWRADDDIIFLNTGDFEGHLYCGRYEDFGTIGPTPSDWMRALTAYLEGLDDEIIVWGSDDFFLSKPMNLEMYLYLISVISSDPEIVCAKLCISLFHKPWELKTLGTDLFVLNDTAEYSSVVQFGVWRREFLIEMLKLASDPWDFELEGSKRLNATGKKVIGAFDSPLKYPDRSATSSTHPGKVSVLGNRVEDIEFLIKAGHLNRDDLIMGLWPGKVKTYEEGKNDQLACLEGSPNKSYDEMALGLCLE